MSNKTQLQTNNNILDALIARVNAAKDVAASLPEAGGSGGGGSGEIDTCMGTLNIDASNLDSFTIYAIDGDLQATTFTLDAMNGGEFVVAKGTIFAITPWSQRSTYVNCTECFSNQFSGVYIANGDFTITFG